MPPVFSLGFVFIFNIARCMAFFTRVQKKLQDKFGSVCYNKTHKKFSKEEARLRNFFVGSRAEKA